MSQSENNQDAFPPDLTWMMKIIRNQINQVNGMQSFSKG